MFDLKYEKVSRGLRLRSIGIRTTLNTENFSNQAPSAFLLSQSHYLSVDHCRYRPYWVKYVRGIVTGCNEKLYAIKRNYVVFRKLVRKIDRELAKKLPELFLDFLKSLLRDMCSTEGAALYACETLRCSNFHPKHLFEKHDSGVTKFEYMYGIKAGPERSKIYSEMNIFVISVVSYPKIVIL